MLLFSIKNFSFLIVFTLIQLITNNSCNRNKQNCQLIKLFHKKGWWTDLYVACTGSDIMWSLHSGNPPNYDAYDEDRYRRTPVRPKPIMIPVDQPPPPRERMYRWTLNEYLGNTSVWHSKINHLLNKHFLWIISISLSSTS